MIRTGAAWIHAFDDPRTAAGQGTSAVEIVEQLGRVPDVVVLPVGGGGCLAGIATYLRSKSDDVAIIGVEPHGAASLSAALVAGGPVTLDAIDPFVDGAAVKRIGALGHRVLASMGATVADHPEVRRQVARQGGTSHVPVLSVDDPLVVTPGTTHITHVDEGAICSEMLDLYQNCLLYTSPSPRDRG